MPGFGTPKHGNNTRPQAKPLLGKEGGSITYRVLPPLMSCVDSGEWCVGHAQHFGYDLPNPADASKPFPKPFYCVEIIRWESGEKITVQACPECKKIAERTSEAAARKGEMESSKKYTEDQVKGALAPLGAWLRRHNKDFSWYFNIKDASGNYSTRKGSGKFVKKPIEAICKDFRAQTPSWDPIAVNQGLWFTSTKTGKQLSAEWTLTVATENKVIDGETYNKPKKAPLTDEDATEAEKFCCDLHDVGIRRLTLEQVKMLVDSDGDESVVKAIFGASVKDQKPQTPENTERREQPASKPVTTSADRIVAKLAEKPAEKPTPKVEKVVLVAKEEAAEDDEVAAAMKALQEAQARKKAKAAAEAAPAKTEQPAKAETPSTYPGEEEAGDAADDADFMEQFRT